MFQREIIRIFGDLKGVLVYFDDLDICVVSEQGYDQIMDTVMTRTSANNIKFNLEKIQYRQREVKFMENILSER